MHEQSRYPQLSVASQRRTDVMTTEEVEKVISS
jgi:hypothetical protein